MEDLLLLFVLLLSELLRFNKFFSFLLNVFDMLIVYLFFLLLFVLLFFLEFNDFLVK